MAYDVLDRDDLGDGATRYDWLRAKPDDETLYLMWSIWAGVSLLSAAACALVLVSIVVHPTTRANGFNLYLVFLMFPDFLFSLLCGITCALNAIHGEYWSPEWMCDVQAVYCVFDFAASPWVNAIVVKELYRLLVATAQLADYSPPTPRAVLSSGGAVYLWSLFLCSWLMVDAVPLRANGAGGMACLPLEYDLGSTLFFWLAFVPLMLVIPMVYVVGTAVYLVRSGLVRHDNPQTTALFVFFMRIGAVFVFMWAPAIALIYIFPMRASVWLAWGGGTWSHLQGLFSALLTLTKPDIRRAVRRSLCLAETDQTKPYTIEVAPCECDNEQT